MKFDRGIFAIAAAVVSNLFWGSSFMASKAVLATCPPITAVAIRLSIALIGFSGLFFFRPASWQIPELKKRFGAVLAFSLVGSTGLYIFQISGLKFVTSSESAAVMLLAPVFTYFCESLLRKKTNLLEVLITLSGLLGVSIILFDRARLNLPANAIQGLILTILAALCLGVSVVQAKALLVPKHDGTSLSVFNLTFYSTLFGAIMVLPFAAMELHQQVSEFHPDTSFWLWSIYLGIFCSVVAFVLWHWSIKYVSAITVTIAMYLKTPLAFVLGAVVLREKLTLIFYFGSITILLAELTDKSHKKKIATAQSELAAKLAHDIRSPLSLINVISKQATGMPEEQRRLLKMASDRINGIAEDLLNKYRSNKNPAANAGILLSPIIERIVTEKRSTHGNAGVSIDFEVPSSDSEIFAKIDETGLARALSNLIENAIEAARDSGARVLVTLSTPNSSQAQIEIRDWGHGMSPEVLARVGEQNFTFGKAKGTGIGFYQARKFINSYNGELRINSALGNGTTVIIILPRSRG